MNVMYVVHPERRGVEGHAVPPNMAAPLYRHMVPQPVSLFYAKELTLGEELEHATVEVCRVEPGIVCPHGWFCTTDLRTAQFVDELRGAREAVRLERAAVVAWLRSMDFVAEFSRPKNLGRRMSDIAADAIERGYHRGEKP
jgi:hypothetical protein